LSELAVPSVLVDFPVGYGHLTVNGFEGRWLNVVEPGKDPPAAVEIDLRNVKYLDQEFLLYLVALVSGRERQKLGTLLALPTASHSLDFLRSWGLPEALATVTGRPFARLLTGESAARFSTVDSDLPRYVRAIDTPGGGREQLLPRSFFRITPINLVDHTPEEAASIVKSTHLDGHLQEVLNRHLYGRGEWWASEVMHEAVLNAGMHGGATKSFTSSQLMLGSPAEEARVPRELVMSIWDNGDSFAQTLQAAFRKHKSVWAPSFGLDDSEFRGMIEDKVTGTSGPLELSARVRSMPKQQELQILAAFFLGVTSLPLESGRASRPGRRLTRAALPRGAQEYGGAGLYLFRRTIIDSFRGSFMYASGPFRVRVHRKKDAKEYTATVLRLRESDPQVHGNLLIARVPLRTR